MPNPPPPETVPAPAPPAPEAAPPPHGALYPYRVRARPRSALVLWVGGGGAPDRVFAVQEDGRARVPVFVTVRQARVYARRRGWVLVDGRAGVLDLGRVRRWLADPVGRTVPAGAALEAWNFFEDLVRGLGAAGRLPAQGPAHDGAYEKLFGGGPAAWTPDERRAVRELMAAGLELWDSCPVVDGRLTVAAAVPNSRRTRGGRGS